jgi:hypothetical protein
VRFVWMLGGFLQAAAGILVGAYGYRAWHVAPTVDGDNAQMFVHGASSFWYFLVATPRGWLALWLFGEGILRALAGAMDQPFSTLPVVIARGLWSLRPAPELPADLMRKSDEAVIIESVHDYDWHALTTIEVDAALYRLAAREAGSEARPHRYRLTPIPHDHLVRTVTRYPLSPDRDRGRDRRRDEVADEERVVEPAEAPRRAAQRRRRRR